MTFQYPNKKDFIFTIIDDTDVATLEYIKPIYELLYSLSLYTTKTVWPLSYNGENDFKGSHTLELSEYAEYIKLLNNRGFEIGFHGASMVSSERSRIKQSLELFHKIIGHYPRSYSAHATNCENLYWGDARLSNIWLKKIYNLFLNKNNRSYLGHREGSAYFWGDLALEHLDYVRSFTFSGINLLRVSKNLPYFNRKTPWVKSWFFTCDADNVEEFNRLICVKNQKRLEHHRGVCIISTHFGKGFLKNGQINPETRYLLELLSKRNGWFVPVSTALDFLRNQRKSIKITPLESLKLELKWFVHIFLRRIQKLNYEKTEIEYLKNSGV